MAPNNSMSALVGPEYCRIMSRYNHWMNERLYAVCAGLPDAERKRDRGAFFGSIHGTLNHLLWGDRMWMGRIAGPECTYPSFGADMFADFHELKRERAATDRAMLDWGHGVSAEWLDAPLQYASRVDAKKRRLPGGVAAMHMFNHGTHHRGQLTTLLKQAGVDPGITDLPWMPGIAEVIG
jgi:uncharacterized damage-inducible protein DinB